MASKISPIHNYKSLTNYRMTLKSQIKRSQGILLYPSQEFKNIAASIPGIFKLNITFTLPLAICISFATLLNSLSGNIEGRNGYLFIGINAIIVLLLVITYLYTSGRIIAYLGFRFHKEKQSAGYYALSVYSQLPFMLILLIIKALPSLFFLGFIGFYSAFLFYTGSGYLSSLNQEKRIQFTGISLMIMILSFILFSELFTLLYNKIIDLFTIFAAN